MKTITGVVKFIISF